MIGFHAVPINRCRVPHSVESYPVGGKGTSLRILKYDPLAQAAVQAIQNGDLETLNTLLDEQPELAQSRIVSGPDACESKATARSLLHVATDWPGHFPNGAAT